MMTSSNHQALWIELTAATYVASGVCQPLLMTQCAKAGLASSGAQLYMVFYYLGPALLLFAAFWPSSAPWKAPWSLRWFAMIIAVFDLFATALNYSGITAAGPTIFAIVYSSVTVWTAVWARIVLQRKLSGWQWVAVCLVFLGLTLTATDTLRMKKEPYSNDSGGDSDMEHENSRAAHLQRVLRGTFLIVIGSALHAGSYVWSEIVLIGPNPLTIVQNTGLQATVAAVAMILWQVFYTLPRWDDLIAKPMEQAQTTTAIAILIFCLFGLANLVHAVTFFSTVKFYKGGSVMAGVFKGLQAVLVFVFTHLLYCGRVGGEEMCFTRGKWLSLFTVISGVVLFSFVTKPKAQDPSIQENDGSVEEKIPGEQQNLLPDARQNPLFQQQYTL